MCVRVCVFLSMCACVRARVSVCVCVCVCVYVCVYVYQRERVRGLGGPSRDKCKRIKSVIPCCDVRVWREGGGTTCRCISWADLLRRLYALAYTIDADQTCGLGQCRLTPSRPALALTLQGRASGRVVPNVLLCKSLTSSSSSSSSSAVPSYISGIYHLG